MRSPITAATLAVVLIVLPGSGHAEPSRPAFPGAEGFGRFATGGRGGAVYHVTNLNDSGPGSFRDAVSRPNRTVVFEIGGIIPISKRVAVSSHVTIAGQTAPGGGVVVYGNGISYSDANNSITRHIRFRMGMNGDPDKDAISIAQGHDMIFDHVSVSWGRDENFSINGNVSNVTIQNCIIAQGLHPHSAGGLIQTSGGVSILRTLYIDNFTRNPKVKGVNQYLNNVVYNWGDGGCYILGDSEGPSFANVIGNYFIDGPDTGAMPFIRGNLNFRIHAGDNFHDANRNGVLDGVVIPAADYGVVAWRETPFDYPPVNLLPPGQALKTVLARAGASLRRDTVDRQLIAEVLSFGRAGQIITRESRSVMNDWGTAAGERELDSDRDGMPDVWEVTMGLNPQDPEDRNQTGSSGYTRLEEYLNWRAEPNATVAGGEPLEIDLRAFTGQPAGVIELSAIRNCSATVLPDGMVRIQPAAGFSGLASLQFSTPHPEPVVGRFGLLVLKLRGEDAAATAREPAGAVPN